MESIFLLLAYLALGRVPSLEQLRYQAPGEWGKLLGLDRIPEVKTLREKKPEFTTHQVLLQHGDTVPLQLAERGTHLGTHLGNGLWLRELRRLDEKGHQTSILSTAYRSDAPTAAAHHQTHKGEALAQLQQQQTTLEALKTQRKATPHHIEFKDLSADQRIHQLRTGRKHFIDTIKLIAYRSETALVHLARETLCRSDDARSFVRGLMQTPINLRPDQAAGELRIELHGQANPAHDAVVTHLCEELNSTKTHYPGTKLRLKYIPRRSSTFLAGQDV